MPAVRDEDGVPAAYLGEHVRTAGARRGDPVVAGAPVFQFEVVDLLQDRFGTGFRLVVLVRRVGGPVAAWG